MSSSFEEIKHNLPNATDQQVERFLEQIGKLSRLKNYLREYPEDVDSCKDQLFRIEKALNYKRPYRIAVIGLTGVGKSTLINSLLGQDLLLIRIAGDPATGAVLEIFSDLNAGQPEEALVFYSDDSDIRQLIKEFIERYKLDELGLTALASQIDAGLVTELGRIEPSIQLNDLERQEFSEFKKIIIEIITQYVNNSQSNRLVSPSRFLLDSSSERERLNQIIDENSGLNSNPLTRQVGLIKRVEYHLQQEQNILEELKLQLPRNVCLVDLPGLDGTPLHDIIIRRGIQEADAVIFIQDPRRFKKQSEIDLLRGIQKYISIEGDVDSGERIFFVLTAKDSIMSDQLPSGVPEKMKVLIDSVVPGYTSKYSNRGGREPYFLIAPWVALQAKQELQKRELKDPNTYRAAKIHLNVETGSAEEVLEASEVPKLVIQLNQFAQKRLVESKLHESKLLLSNIIDSLYAEYKREYDRLFGSAGKASFQIVESTLAEQRSPFKSNMHHCYHLLLIYKKTEGGGVEPR